MCDDGSKIKPNIFREWMVHVKKVLEWRERKMRKRNMKRANRKFL